MFMNSGHKNDSDAAISGLFDTRSDLLKHLDEGVPGYSSNRNVYLVGLFTMASFAVPLNLAAGALLIQRHFWRSNVNILLFQLAIADLLVSAFCIIGDAIWNWTISWTVGDGFCRLYKFMQMFSLYASTFILTGISIDRCLAVLFPLSRFGSREKLFRVRCLSVTAWILAGVCAAPQALIFHIESAPFNANFKQCVTHGAYSENWQEVAYSLSTVVIMFFAPMLIMTLCYIAIFARITKEARLASGPDQVDLFNQPGSTRRRLYSQARRATLWMTLVFVICFIVCWAPYYVGMFCFLLQVNSENESLGLIFCFGMCSAIINPLIYGSFSCCCKQPKHAPAVQKQQQKNYRVAGRGGRGFKENNIAINYPYPAAGNNQNIHVIRNNYDPHRYLHSANDRHPRLMIKFKSRPNNYA